MKKIKQHTVDWAQIDRFVASAEKKLTSAHKILAFDARETDGRLQDFRLRNSFKYSLPAMPAMPIGRPGR
jgi:hypothetical protein